MISGGFSSGDTFEYDAILVASYPSSANTWTAAAAASSTFLLSVQVYCLPASLALGVTAVQAPVSPTGSATCPTEHDLAQRRLRGRLPSDPVASKWEWLVRGRRHRLLRAGLRPLRQPAR